MNAIELTSQTKQLIEQRLGVSPSAIEAFCQRWHITEFALFGSVLRNDFREDSDIDVLVTFAPEYQRGLVEAMQMQEEIQTLFQRKVDVIVKSAITNSRNWLRRDEILQTAQVIYDQQKQER